MCAFSAPNQKHTSDYTIGPSVQPLVIYGEGWSQQFTIINVEYYQPEPTIGILHFYRSDGQPWRIPLKGYGTTDQVAVNLQPGKMLVIQTEVSQQPQQLGWAALELSSNIDQWGIYHAFTTFRKQTPGSPDLMTSVPFVDGLEDEWIIPFDNTEGKFPGIAVVNAYSRTDTFTFDVYDTTDTRRTTFQKTIGPNNLLWFSLLAEHPELAGVAGQIKIHSQGLESAVFSLQFAGNGAFTALPMVHTFGMR